MCAGTGACSFYCHNLSNEGYPIIPGCAPLARRSRAYDPCPGLQQPFASALAGLFEKEADPCPPALLKSVVVPGMWQLQSHTGVGVWHDHGEAAA